MDELLEYNEPSSSKPPPAQIAKKAADSSNDISVLDFLEAIAKVQQQQEEKQSVESIFDALLSQNIVNQYNENLARLRIQQYLQEQKEKEEQKTKQQEQLRMQMALRQLQTLKEKEEQEAREQLAAQIFSRSLFQR